METTFEPKFSSLVTGSVLNTNSSLQSFPELASAFAQGTRSFGDLFRNDRVRRTTSELVERLRAECRYIQEQREAARTMR